MRDFSCKKTSIQRWLLIYGIEAVICLMAVIMSISFSVYDLLAFPYGQIGYVLRILSFRGGICNVLAWILYGFLSLIPAAVWGMLRHKGKAVTVDRFLPCFTVLLFFFLYMAVNPSVLFDLTGASTQVASVPYLISSCALVLDSLVLLYLVIRLLRYCKAQDDRKMIRNLRNFFYLFGFVLVIIIFAKGPGSLMESIEKVKGENTDFAVSLTWTYLFLVLKTLKDFLPAAAEFIPSLLAVRLLYAMEADSYGEETVKAAERLARVSYILLILILGFTACCNLLNLFCQSENYQVSIFVDIPLFYIGFSIVLILISRYLSNGRQLKQDHDLFI